MPVAGASKSWRYDPLRLFTLCSINKAMAGPIRTIRQAARHGMILAVTCRGCGHVARFMASDVVQFVNPVREIEALPFRCGECGAKDCSVKASEYDRDRRPDIVVWRPMRLR
jgi:RNase P subunit RPR2